MLLTGVEPAPKIKKTFCTNLYTITTKKVPLVENIGYLLFIILFIIYLTISLHQNIVSHFQDCLETQLIG